MHHVSVLSSYRAKLKDIENIRLEIIVIESSYRHDVSAHNHCPL